jgi:hypothetical protein
VLSAGGVVFTFRWLLNQEDGTPAEPPTLHPLWVCEAG